MGSPTISVLLIEDSTRHAAELRTALEKAGGAQFALTTTDTLTQGLVALDAEAIEVVLLDLNLPDSAGLATLQAVREHAPDVPVVVLTAVADDETAVAAVRLGAQDFLVKGEVNAQLIVRSLRYALERHQSMEALRGLAMIDDLTGLYNRRGFMSLVEHHVKLAQRAHKQLLLIFADLDGFKAINDNFGHQEGDIALIETADALRRTFRGSDIIARLGGDEFAVLAVEPSGVSSDTVLARLRENLAAFNERPGRGYTLSLSSGAMRFDPWSSFSILDLIARVDEAMYQQKRGRR